MAFMIRELCNTIFVGNKKTKLNIIWKFIEIEFNSNRKLEGFGEQVQTLVQIARHLLQPINNY